MSTCREQITLGPDALAPELSSRTLLFLDTNIWIDLANQATTEAKECFQVLREAVAAGRLLCPLNASLIWELYKEHYASALAVAAVMDDLSLSTTFASTDEVRTTEARYCLEGLLSSKVITPPRRDVLVPLISYLSSHSHLEFDDSWPSQRRQAVVQLVADRMKGLTVTELINVRKESLPRPERRPPPYAEAARRRAEYAKGNKRKAWLAEAYTIVSSVALPKMAAIRSTLPLRSQLAVLAASCRLPQDSFKSRIVPLLERMPSLLVETEVMTLSGFDTQRRDSMRDFYDLEMLVIPFAYCDALASRDRWMRHITQSQPVMMKEWPSQFLYGLGDVVRFLDCSLVSGRPVAELKRDIEPAVRLAPEEEAEFLDALDEADREEGISAEELFERLRRHG